jgi:hypothetical protein
VQLLLKLKPQQKKRNNFSLLKCESRLRAAFFIADSIAAPPTTYSHPPHSNLLLFPGQTTAYLLHSHEIKMIFIN